MPKFKLTISHGISVREAGWKEMTWKHIPRVGEKMFLDARREYVAEVSDVQYLHNGKIEVDATIPYDSLQSSALGGYNSSADAERLKELKKLGFKVIRQE